MATLWRAALLSAGMLLRASAGGSSGAVTTDAGSTEDALHQVAGSAGHDEHWCHEEAECSFIETLVLFVLVFIATVFEVSWHHFEHSSRHTYRYGDLGKKEDGTRKSAGEVDFGEVGHLRLQFELVNRTGGEFMTLGVIAFVVFIANQAGLFKYLEGRVPKTGPNGAWHYPATEMDWFHIVEIVHMKLFIGMVLYFVLISRMAAGSMQTIRQWERCTLRSHLARSTTMEIQASEDHDLADHIMWRRYFFIKMVRLQCQSRGDFEDLLRAVHCDGSPTSFLSLLERDFPFGVYIAANVETGVGESIHVRQSTWLWLLVILGVFAILNRFAGISLLGIAPVVAGLALVFLAVMHCVILHTRRRIINRVHAMDSEGNWPGPSPEAAQCLRQRRRKDLVMLRALQLILFLICYLFARTLLGFSDWQNYTQTTILVVSLFTVLYVALAFGLPRAVPLFLGMMAMPPHVDRVKFGTFCAVLVKATEELRSRALFSLHERLVDSDFETATYSTEGGLDGIRPRVSQVGLLFNGIVEHGRTAGLLDKDIVASVMSQVHQALRLPRRRMPDELHSREVSDWLPADSVPKADFDDAADDMEPGLLAVTIA